MRFESQTHPQDDHRGRITDCSTRYGQAHAVSTRVRLAKGRCIYSTLFDQLTFAWIAMDIPGNYNHVFIRTHI